jgi:glycine cleavage system regulatory protein
VTPADETPGRVLECVVTGVDKAGIVARIARTLADERANIEDLRTELKPEPESGTPIYTMRIAMRVPPGVDERALRKRLEQVAASLNVDVAVGEPGTGA